MWYNVTKSGTKSINIREKSAYLSHFEQFCTILYITYDNLTLSVNTVKAHKISDSLRLVKNSSKIILRISDSRCQTPPVSYLP